MLLLSRLQGPQSRIRIGCDQVHRIRVHGPQNLQAVAVEQCAISPICGHSGTCIPVRIAIVTSTTRENSPPTISVVSKIGAKTFVRTASFQSIPPAQVLTRFGGYQYSHHAKVKADGIRRAHGPRIWYSTTISEIHLRHAGTPSATATGKVRIHTEPIARLEKILNHLLSICAFYLPLPPTATIRHDSPKLYLYITTSYILPENPKSNVVVVA